MEVDVDGFFTTFVFAEEKVPTTSPSIVWSSWPMTVAGTASFGTVTELGAASEKISLRWTTTRPSGCVVVVEF